MARPYKEGLDYFPLDVDMAGDDKVLLVESRHGVAGFGILVRLLMEIYKNGYYYPWTEKELRIFSYRLNYEPEAIQEVVRDALEWEFFHPGLYQQYGILTSRGIQKRYLEITAKRKQLNLIDKYMLVEIPLKEKTVNVVRNSPCSPVNVVINSQSKVKESKEKEKEKKSKDKVRRRGILSTSCTSVPELKEEKKPKNPRRRPPERYPVEFEKFWEAYPGPKDRGKQGAYQGWLSCLEKGKDRGITPACLVTAALNYRAVLESPGKKPAFIMPSGNFLNRNDYFTKYAGTSLGSPSYGQEGPKGNPTGTIKGKTEPAATLETKDQGQSAALREVKDIPQSTALREVKDQEQSAIPQEANNQQISAASREAKHPLQSTALREVKDLPQSAAPREVKDLPQSAALREVKDQERFAIPQEANNQQISAASREAKHPLQSVALREVKYLPQSNALREVKDQEQSAIPQEANNQQISDAPREAKHPLQSAALREVKDQEQSAIPQEANNQQISAASREAKHPLQSAAPREAKHLPQSAAPRGARVLPGPWTDPACQDIINHFSQNISPVTPREAEILMSWVDEGMEPGVINWAIDQSVEQGVRRISYVQGILRNLHTAGVTTLQAALDREKEFQERKGRRGANGENRRNTHRGHSFPMVGEVQGYVPEGGFWFNYDD